MNHEIPRGSQNVESLLSIVVALDVHRRIAPRVFDISQMEENLRIVAISAVADFFFNGRENPAPVLRLETRAESFCESLQHDF